MIHRADEEVLEAIFPNGVPQDVADKYGVYQALYHGPFGGSGPLGTLMIPLLDRLGYGRLSVVAPEQIDWRLAIGERVLAKYGDQQLPGVLEGIGVGTGTLMLRLDGVPGETELPRHAVKLAPVIELVMEKAEPKKADLLAEVEKKRAGPAAV